MMVTFILSNDVLSRKNAVEAVRHRSNMRYELRLSFETASTVLRVSPSCLSVFQSGGRTVLRTR